jgi:competence ComEA-like helix-hairpin-helix protein
MLSNSEKRVIFFIIVVLLGGSLAGFLRPSLEEKPEKITTFPININSASADELTLLPGIGEVTAKKVLEYRIKNNGFKTKNEIMEVNGIGIAKFEKIKDKICVERVEEEKKTTNHTNSTNKQYKKRK